MSDALSAHLLSGGFGGCLAALGGLTPTQLAIDEELLCRSVVRDHLCEDLSCGWRDLSHFRQIAIRTGALYLIDVRGQQLALR